MRPIAHVLMATILGSAALSACESSGPPAAPATHILAGSELKDLEPMLPDLEKSTGVHVVFDYIGTLDGAERIAGGDSHGLAWFSSNRYLSLLPGASTKILSKQRIMLSPVILGVKRGTAARLGWTGNPNVTWRDIANQAKAGNFKFAMTDPSSSNSGFSALVGVASAFAGTGNALQASDINSAALSEFFSGQGLTAGSSGFLADSYAASQDSLDGIVNYESVLLTLNASRKLREPLDLIYPREGIVTADYPLMLLAAPQRSAYDKLAAYFQKPGVQREIMVKTARRPVLREIGLDPRFSAAVLVEVPFPSNLDVVNRLLTIYLDTARPPSHTYFVLDISGSMAGQRLSDLKQAFANLTGLDTSVTGQFAHFHAREQLTIITFNGQVTGTRDFTIHSTDPNGPDQTAVRRYVNGLQASDGTAIYDALFAAYEQAIRARSADPGLFYSIVLMTDGQSNTGRTAGDFAQYYRSSRSRLGSIKTFAVIFGEASPKELADVAILTGGQTFDARSSTLAQVFKQMRGYE